MRNFGIFLTMIIMATVFTLGVTSSNLLLKSKNYCKKSNYSTIGYFIFRSSWIIYTVNVIIVLSNMGTCLSELM